MDTCSKFKKIQPLTFNMNVPFMLKIVQNKLYEAFHRALQIEYPYQVSIMLA